MTDTRTETNIAPSQGSSAKVQLKGLIAFKVGMTSVFGESGKVIPVTVLRYEPLVVSQVKRKETDGYEAVQVATHPRQSSKALAGHLKKGGFENGARYTREIRQEVPAEVSLGNQVDLQSLKKGDLVSLTSNSRGKGFSGVVRRWNFAGGPASHGSGFHRKPGSVGNRTWPGRVMPGKRMAGHYGNEKVTVRNLEVIEILNEENVVLVKGAVPGSRNSLVTIMKVEG